MHVCLHCHIGLMSYLVGLPELPSRAGFSTFVNSHFNIRCKRNSTFYQIRKLCQLHLDQVNAHTSIDKKILQLLNAAWISASSGSVICAKRHIWSSSKLFLTGGL